MSLPTAEARWPCATDRAFSPRRIGALVMRYVYLLKNSWPRIFELMYWPTIQMILWGFITQFFATNSTWIEQAFGVLLSGVLLWDVMFRGQLGFSISFLEEMWSRNLGHLFISPLRPYEFALAMMTMSLIRTVIGVLPAMVLAIPLYHYSIFTLGLPLIAFFTMLLVTGWAVGLVVSGLILRFGLGAESLAWLSIFLLAPISCVYYPLDTLPGWLQGVALSLPPAHVFEGMRAILVHGSFEPARLAAAAGLNVVYLALAGWLFLYMLKLAREKGLLLQQGE